MSSGRQVAACPNVRFRKAALWRTVVSRWQLWADLDLSRNWAYTVQTETNGSDLW